MDVDFELMILINRGEESLMTFNHGADLIPMYFSENWEKKKNELEEKKNFRNFLLAPNKTLPREKQFNGKDSKTEGELKEAFGFLSSKMKIEAGHERTDPDKIQDWENESIPSGYTYLAQLIGHDLVHSSMSVGSLSDAAPINKNLRTTKLMLDTLYGGGPSTNKISYYRPCRQKIGYEGIPNYLRMSNIRKFSNGKVKYTDEFYDLPRARVLTKDFEKHRTHISKEAYNGLPEVLVADSRNDDNAILAQLTALFHRFHNTVIKTIENNEDNESKQREHHRTVQDLINFHKARNIVIYTYHKIIQEDFLPKILHPRIYEYYKTHKKPLIDKYGSSDVSLEFSNAAFRFGHAMIRSEYVISSRKREIGSVIDHSSDRQSDSFPLWSNWVIDWSDFFYINSEESSATCRKRVANLSRKISPYMTTALSDLPDRGRDRRLPFRDLLRGGAANIPLWSVPALVNEIVCSKINTISDLFKQSDLLFDPCYREEKIEKHLGRNEYTKFLANDPPLFFFVLFESCLEEQGRYLGLLGSVIIAETIFTYLRESTYSRDVVLNGISSANVSNISDVKDDLLDISNMNDLILFVNKHSLEDYKNSIL